MICVFKRAKFPEPGALVLPNTLFDRMVSVFPGFFLCVIKASEIARDKAVSRRGRNGADTWGGGGMRTRRDLGNGGLYLSQRRQS